MLQVASSRSWACFVKLKILRRALFIQTLKALRRYVDMFYTLSKCYKIQERSSFLHPRNRRWRSGVLLTKYLVNENRRLASRSGPLSVAETLQQLFPLLCFDGGEFSGKYG